MLSFMWSVLLLAMLAALFGMCKTSMEPFEDIKMRPWFGYEPGYGPDWGRKGCCNTIKPMPQ